MEFYDNLLHFSLRTRFLVDLAMKFDLLMLYGNIESNLGPRLNFSKIFSICHCNFNSIGAHIFSKIYLLKV